MKGKPAEPMSKMVSSKNNLPEKKSGPGACHEPGVLNTPLPSLNDPEGARVPPALPFIVDAHVHIFPDGLFPPIWQWFEQFAWPIRYKLKAADVIHFLLSRGIGHIVALQYAHKPGIARNLNAFMADLCSRHSRITGLATVFPGENGAAEILKDAFSLGLSGVKLHAHVQGFDMIGKDMQTVYDLCALYGKPLVIHAGREPKSPAYSCDPYLLCSAEKLERILRAHPALKICVPHLGADEFTAYQKLIERYDTLWLDTTMMLADYFPNSAPPPLNRMRTDRIMFGTDFPNLPYAWDREIQRLSGANLPEESLARILGKNAASFFSMPIQE